MNRLNLRELQNPSMQYRPMARWWWPGMDVEEDVLISQLEDLKNGGFAGGEIQAFLRGLSHLDANDREQMLKAHGYGTERYFALIRRLMEKARELGLLLEMTAGSGYPLGDTRVEPERDGMKALIVGASYVPGGKTQRVKLISAQTSFNQLIGPERSGSYMTGTMVVWSMDWPRMRRELRLSHVTIARGDRPEGKMSARPDESVLLDLSSMKDVSGFVKDDELVYPFPEGDWYVFAAYEGPSCQRVKTDSRIDADGESYVVDHFSSGKAAPYLDRHIGRGFLEAYSGSPLRAVFLDSFELVGPYFWSEGFLTEFRNRRGYELTPYLPLLMTREHSVNEAGHAIACFDTVSDAGERIRRDYDLTLAELFSDYFLSEATGWAHAHGLKTRVQCYGHAMDPLAAYGRVDIPETEQLASAGLLDFMKMASSAALLYKKPLVTAEAFVWSGCDYMESPARLLMAGEKLTSAGVGQLIYHGMPYIHTAYAWPGYFAWHNSFGSFINRNSLIWPYIAKINAAIARNQYLVQSGRRLPAVGLYFGSLRSELPYTGPEFREELSDGEIPGFDRRERYDSIRFDTRCDRWQYLAVRARRAALFLTQGGYDYAHINAESLINARLDGDTLLVGDAAFKALVVPGLPFIDVRAAERIRELADSGFPVLCTDEKPCEAFGFKDAAQNDGRVKVAFEGTKLVPLNELTDELREAGILPDVDFCAQADFDATKREYEGGSTAYFIRSHSQFARLAKLRFNTASCDAVLFDTRTGGLARVKASVQDGWALLALPFVPFGAMWVLFDSGIEAEENPDWLTELSASVSGKTLCTLNQGWCLNIKSAVQGDEKQTRRAPYTLNDWADDDELGGYTGWGIYENRLDMGQAVPENAVLDLGKVADIAVVYINGQRLGERLAPPYAFKLDKLLKPGINCIRVEVLNSLRNGMIAAGRLQTPHARAVSGLLGPVCIKLPDEKE